MVRIPVEYQEVEYIQGTSNARIDTGIPGNNDNLVISGKVYLNKFSAYQGLFGNYIDEDHNTSRLIMGATTNGVVIANINRRAGSSSVAQVGFYAGNVGEFKVSKTKLVFNGTKYSYGGVNNATANDTNILLNVSNPATTTSNSVLYRRWYYFRINDGDTMLRNFIPCYRKSDSKPGMYDTVTNQFFAGYGTEEFIVGNDVSWDTASLIERRRQILLNTPHLTTASANPLTFQTDISAPIKDCKIYFEPVQDLHGYDKPYPAGGGKNLLNTHDVNYENATISPTGGKTTGNDRITTDFIPCNPGETYTMSGHKSTGGGTALTFAGIAGFDENKEFVSREFVNNQWSVSYTVPSNVKYIRFFEQISSEGTSVPITPSVFEKYQQQLELGSSATDYEPYENICPITGWDGVTVTRRGKNLFDEDSVTISSLSPTYFPGGSLVSGDRNGFDVHLPVGIYTLKLQTNITTYTYGNVLNNDNSFASFLYLSTSSVSNPTTISLTKGQFIRIFRGTAGDLTIKGAGLQIEQGSTPTAYEPYTGTSLTIPFPQTIYGGYVDLVKGEVVETYHPLNMGILDYIYRSDLSGFSLGGFSAAIAPHYGAPYAKDRWKGVCSKYAYVGVYTKLANKTQGIGYVFFKDVIVKDINVTIDDPEVMKASLDGVTLCYELATPITHQLADGLNHITLGQDISPRPNDRSSTGGYANSTATGIDGCKFVYFELGWPTEAFLQYSADISRQSEFVSDSRVLINGTTTDAKLGEMIISTGSATDYDGDALVYLYVSVPSDCTDLESKRAYLAEHPVKITYPKKSPVPYTIDMNDLKPVKGTNNVWSNANGNIKIRYWEH